MSKQSQSKQSAISGDDEVRLDIWLWSVRQFKTRSLATKEIKAGRVKVNGGSCKPSTNVRVGDRVNVRKPPYEFHFIIDKIISKRVGAAIAVECYSESEQSIAQRAEIAENFKFNAQLVTYQKGRPTKRDRRELNRVKWKDG